MGEDPNEKKEVKEELSKSRKQMEESRLRLTKLKSHGRELVSNIRVAGDAREASRRIEEEEARRQRREKLEAEAKVGAERFEEIIKKWESSLQKEIPQDLYESLMQQKSACDAMIDEKNKLINEFQMELKAKDDQYVKDLKKQAEDVDLLIERMDEQVKELTKADRQEITQIEKAFVAERTELLEQQRSKWDAMMVARQEKEVDYMRARQKRVDDYEQQLQQLRVQDAEEYNTVKIKLETDVQILEQQLQQMRATYQLNQEKLEYNFQVLRKRDEENTITKSQQKRKITRLQDVLTNLKIKLSKQEKQYKDDNQQLTEDYKRITEQFKELQKKSKHFMATDAKKFHDMWCMNEDEAKSTGKKVVEIDRIIHEQQLGLAWNRPDMSFLETSGPIASEKSKQKAVSAHQVVQEVLAATEAAEKSEEDRTSEKAESFKSALLQQFSPKLVKTILELLCDETGFLIEAKLHTLLSPLERDEQSLMKLDAIFSALGVDTEHDIQQLASYFIGLREKGSSKSTGSALHSTREEESQGAGSHRPKSAEENELDREVEEVTGPTEDGGYQTPQSSKGDTELIHPNDVLKALRTFVEENRHPPKERGKQAQFKIAAIDERDDSDDAVYWSTFPSMLPVKTERMWDALGDGLEKYREALQSRSTLITDTDALRQHNAELRMLLHQYVNSKVNQELEVPPTRVLQLDVNH